MPGAQYLLRVRLHMAWCLLRHGAARRARAQRDLLMLLVLLSCKVKQPL